MANIPLMVQMPWTAVQSSRNIHRFILMIHLVPHHSVFSTHYSVSLTAIRRLNMGLAKPQQAQLTFASVPSSDMTKLSIYPNQGLDTTKLSIRTDAVWEDRPERPRWNGMSPPCSRHLKLTHIFVSADAGSVSWSEKDTVHWWLEEGGWVTCTESVLKIHKHLWG